MRNTFVYLFCLAVTVTQTGCGPNTDQIRAQANSLNQRACDTLQHGHVRAAVLLSKKSNALYSATGTDTSAEEYGFGRNLAYALDVLKNNQHLSTVALVNFTDRQASENSELGCVRDFLVDSLRKIADTRKGIAVVRQRSEAKAATAKYLEGKAIRQAYAAKLRDKFLDDGKDIKVEVSGLYADNIELSYVLFNDVWAHQMGKGTLLPEMRDLGFTYVSITDGYNYTARWKL